MGGAGWQLRSTAVEKRSIFVLSCVYVHWETREKGQQRLGVTNEPSILVVVERERVLFFSSSLPFSNKCRKDRRGCPPCHLQRTPICPLFQVGFCSHWNGVYLMDMKDHLAHGPFGKLTYWSSCGTRRRHFLFFPCMRGMCCCTERER